ncbi:hypothetical protein LPJ63_002723 [Coemansia sp. RSA 2711]|nr:hypothetical protein LPJ63_002723 [Coemansia sp. RSA 2711]
MDDPVGRWISVDGASGVVRYAGPVAGTAGTWLGVEWTTPGRGRHRGEHGGRQYFRCHVASAEPTGSFIRNVARINWGQSLEQAAHERYTPDGALQLPRAIDGRRGRIEAPRLDMIAALQGDLARLPVLGLDGMQVHGLAGDLHEFASVRTLSLADNVLASWARIDAIVGALPGALDTLDVSANPLHSPLDVPAEPLQRPVRLLRIDTAPHVCWPDICRIARRLQVRALSHGWSRLARIDAELPASLAELRLEYNMVGDWAPLARLPLVRVALAGNAELARLDNAPADGFQTLEELDVSHTGIAHWRSVDFLARLPRLRALRIGATPLVAGLPADAARAQLIARLPRVTKLDGSAVDARHRADMERYFLALHARNPDADDVKLDCARYAQLVSVHGAPRVPPPPPAHKLDARLADVELQLAADLSGPAAASVRRPLIRSMLVRQLRPLAMRLAKSRRFQMHLKRPQLDWIALDSDSRPLSFYGIDDNAVIRIIPD